MPTKMQLVHEPDVTTWELDSLDAVISALEDSVKNAVQEVVRLACQDKADISFGIEWSSDEDEGSDGRGGPEITDPMVLLIDLPLGPQQDVDATWRVSLEDAITNLIELHERGVGGRIEGKIGERIAELRDGLRRLADRLDERIN